MAASLVPVGPARLVPVMGGRLVPVARGNQDLPPSSGCEVSLSGLSRFSPVMEMHGCTSTRSGPVRLLPLLKCIRYVASLRSRLPGETMTKWPITGGVLAEVSASGTPEPWEEVMVSRGSQDQNHHLLLTPFE